MSTSSESSEHRETREEVQLPLALENLATLIGEKPETLATGSEDLRKAALDATKFLYDLALGTENTALKSVNELLTSISPHYAPRTRSHTAIANGNLKRKRGADALSPPQPPITSMKETPLAELFVHDMSDQQIWAELELRATNVCDVLDFALDGPTRGAGSEEDGVEEGDSDGDENLNRIRQTLLDEGFDPEELERLTLGEDDEVEFFDNEESEEEDENVDEDESDEEAEEDEDEDVGEDADLGEGVEELRDPSDEDEDDDEDPAPFGKPTSLNGVKRMLKRKSNRGGHSVLDDGFFDLAAFNAEIEAAESKSVSRGKLSQDDDDEDEDEDEGFVDLFASVESTPAFDEKDLEDSGDLSYKDYFEPPSWTKFPNAKKPPQAVDGPSTSTAKVRFHEEVRVKKIKAKGKNLPVSTIFYEEDEDGEDEDDCEAEERTSEDDDTGEDEEILDGNEAEAHGTEDSDQDISMEEVEEMSGMVTIERTKDDLFADEEDDPQDGLSTHEKRMAALDEEIAAMEAENVGKKDWTLMGEAMSRTRPQNSLLEEDLEFERLMKSVPVITEDAVQSLEERIRARIIENQFDDVMRKRSVVDKPFLPSRFFELQDTKSKQSLAEIYEEEYTAAQTGAVAGEDRDGKLKKEHQEIDKLWENICSKLDALCNAHFTPKALKGTITSVSNVAAASLESALPSVKATSTMLAPEELYAPASSDLRSRSELTPTEKRAVRNKQKKANKVSHDAIQKRVEHFGRPKGVGGEKRQKEAALKTLVKSGKGVTVIGKTSKEIEGRRGPGRT